MIQAACTRVAPAQRKIDRRSEDKYRGALIVCGKQSFQIVYMDIGNRLDAIQLYYCGRVGMKLTSIKEPLGNACFALVESEAARLGLE
jgi:hypothetical protein